MSTLSAVDAVRCSTWSRSQDLDPIGSVGSYRGYLLVETPLPWPRDVNQMPALAGAGASVGWRLQALVPAVADAAPEDREVILHEWSGEGLFDGFRRHRARQGASLAATVAGLASRPETGGTDVLVCTHGRRDVCCGSLGTNLALQLSARAPSGAGDVRFRRTSHTGGHRFAATFVVLPQGTAWAYADVSLVDQVLERSVPFAEVAGRYRGCAGLRGPQVQALEREVLVSVGWELHDRPRTGSVTGERTADGGLVVGLEAGSDRWEAVARPGRTLPVPDCMKPISEAKKTETEWVISDVRHLS